MNNETKYPLLEALKEYGFEYLIPLKISSYDDNNELPGHVYVDDEEYEDELYDEIYIDEEDDNNHNNDNNINSIYNLDELMWTTNRDYMDPKEFLQLMPWELFGLTKNQFKMLNAEYMYNCNINVFLSELENPKNIDLIPSIEQRIKYAMVCSVTDAQTIPSILNSYAKEIKLYIVRLISKHNLSQCERLLQLYKDYIRCYTTATIINNRRQNQNELNGTNEPVFKYTINPKPSHLEDLHDKAVRDNEIYLSEQNAARLEELNENIKFTTDNFMYKGLLYKNNEYSIIPVTSFQDLEKEGQILNHCVVSYANAFSHGETYIYFLRKNDELNIPFFTIEVLTTYINGVPENYINQCYGQDNTIDKPETCRKFIKEWAKKKNIKIRCEI